MMISNPNTVVDPRAMMIEALYAMSAKSAMP
jgi:hypothetical protein